MNDLASRISNLTPEKRKQLEEKLKEKKNTILEEQDVSKLRGAGLKNQAPIEPAVEQEYYVVSPAQKRIYILNQMGGASASYNIPGALLIKGQLDRNKLAEVFRRISARHETLRTSFEMINGEPVQRIHPKIDFQIEYWDLADDPAGADSNPRLQKIIRDFIRPFDLKQAPLFRIGVIQLDENQQIMICDFHHIITDLISMGILEREIMDLYSGQELPPLRIQYKDYAAWHASLKSKESHGEVWKNQRNTAKASQNQEKYWLEQFQGEIPILNLPTDHPRPAIQSFEGEHYKFTLAQEICQQLNALAVSQGSTLYMILLAVFNILLSRYSGQEDIIIGSPIAGRTHPDLEHIIGVFINTLVLRNHPGSGKSFLDFLTEVKTNALKAYENQDYQYAELVEKLVLPRDLSRNPLFDVMFILQNVDVVSREIQDIQFLPYALPHQISKFDLTLAAFETPASLNCTLEYSTKLFSRETIVRFAGHFHNLIQAICANPERKLAEFEILNKSEKRQILIDFNATQAEYPPEKTILQLFEEQVERTPEAIAAVFADQSLTYRELNQKTNQLARVLREKGAGPNTIIGIMTERSLSMMIGLLGILKAGSAYLPIDPEYPRERIKFMLEDSGARILLVNSAVTPCDDFYGEVLNLDGGWLEWQDQSPLEKINHPADLAYLIYTSGSTGRPKGVIIEQRAVHNFIVGITRRIEFSPAKIILALTTISFDIFGLETLLPLTQGLKVIIATEQEQRDSRLLSKIIRKNKINMLQITPSRMRLLLSDPAAQSCFKTVTEIMVGGEALPENLLIEIRQLTSAKIYNMYGPTETTIWSTLKDVSLDSAITIGAPIANTQVYILDRNNQPQPIGVAGELCLAGDGLARGYLNRPDLTAEKFVVGAAPPQEEAPPTERIRETPARMYRTGDLARWLPDGNIEFLGRMDYQVKIRGYRIELGETESQLLQHEAIREAVIIVHEDEDGVFGPGGDKRLCAYYVSERELTVPELRDYLASALPDYMIPAFFIPLKEMPLTASGKINRKMLPKPGGIITTGVKYVAPRNDIEALLVKIWQEVLKIDRVGVQDEFFVLGGDSLKALGLINMINKEFQIGLTFDEILKRPTVEGLALLLKGDHGIRSADHQAEQGIVSGEINLIPIQKIFFRRKFSEKHHWNISSMFYSKGDIEEKALSQAIYKVVEHHDALRIVFQFEGNEIHQYNRGLDEGELFQLTIMDYTAEENYLDLIKAEVKKIHTSMDLAKGPLLKAGLFKTREGTHLLMAIHHLVADGVSQGFIMEDLISAYQQALNGQEIQFQRKTDSLMDWSKAIYRYANSPQLLNELEYWKKIEEAEVIPFPKDGHAEQDRVLDSDTIIMVLLSAEETSELLRASKLFSQDVQTLLLTGLGYTIAEWTGSKNTPVTMIAHGRDRVIEDLDISRTVGWLSIGYPVMLEVDLAKDISWQVDHVKKILTGVPKNGIGYDLLKYITLPVNKPSLEFKLKPPIIFNFMGQTDAGAKKTNPSPYSLVSSPIAATLGQGVTMTLTTDREFTFEISIHISGERIHIKINYNKYEYLESTILNLIAGYARNLRKITTHFLSR